MDPLGNAGRQLASAMVFNSAEIRVEGYLDDDDRLHGHVLNGLPIHNPTDLAEFLAEVSITDRADIGVAPAAQ